jgi:hypothetical protein
MKDFLIGLAVIALLTAIGLFFINKMRCDPMYADSALALSNRACRE